MSYGGAAWIDAGEPTREELRDAYGFSAFDELFSAFTEGKK